jgi:hypothetical protein
MIASAASTIELVTSREGVRWRRGAEVERFAIAIKRL